MAMDPKKLSLLTSALAASIALVGSLTAGCSDSPDSDESDGGSRETTSSGNVASSGGTSSGDGGASGASTSSSGGSSGDGGSGTSGAIDGLCLGDDGAVPSCEDQTGCLTAYEHEDMCTGTAAVFRPAIARNIVECLRLAPTCERGNDASQCAQDAVDRACPIDPTFVTDYCNDMIAKAKCTPAEADGFGARCAALAPALTRVGRDGVGSCLHILGCNADRCLDPSWTDTMSLPAPTPNP